MEQPACACRGVCRRRCRVYACLLKLTGRENTLYAPSEETHLQLFLRSNSLQSSGRAGLQRGETPGLRANKQRPPQTTQPRGRRAQNWRATHETPAFQAPSDDACARIHVYIPAQDTRRHAVLTKCTDEQANKDNKQTNKRQINIMAATETA